MHLMDACDNVVRADVRGMNDEVKRLGLQVMERLVVYYVTFKTKATVAFEDFE